jgi:hypothetical protein
VQTPAMPAQKKIINKQFFYTGEKNQTSSSFILGQKKNNNNKDKKINNPTHFCIKIFSINLK